MTKVYFKRGVATDYGPDEPNLEDSIIFKSNVGPQFPGFSEVYLGSKLVGAGHIFDYGLKGLVPAPEYTDIGKVLSTDGWKSIEDIAGIANVFQNPIGGSSTDRYPLILKNTANVDAETNKVNFSAKYKYGNPILSATAGGDLFAKSLAVTELVKSPGFLVSNPNGSPISGLTAETYIKADGSGYGGVFTGAGESAGSVGLVPAPAIGDAGKYLKGDGTWENIQCVTDLVVPTTYSDLVALKTGGNLVPGTQYRITDYTCTTTQTNTQSAGHPFDIIVTADSETELNENARAAQHRSVYVTISEGTTSFTTPSGFDAVDLNSAMRSFPAQSGDRIMCMTGTTTFCIWDEADGEWAGSLEEFEPSKTYNFITTSQDVRQLSLYLDTYFQNCDLDSWELKYCLENDANRFDWASTNGKGVIYYMKDEWKNECPYDFKNIQFKRKLTGGALDDQGTDTWCYTFNGYNSNESEYYDMSSHMFYISEQTRQDAIDDGDGADECDMCYNNVILPAKYADNLEYKDIKTILNNIVFLGESYDDGYENGYSVSYCFSNVFGNDCYDNTFGNDCYDNTFGNSCYYNSFGNHCYSNSFENDCFRNSFGNNCNRNSFGNYCYSNSFGNSCYYNSFGNNCNRNSFGNYCYYNSFGNSCYYNTFGNYCQAMTVFDEVRYCNVTGGTSYSAPVKNAQILNGTKGTSSSSKLTITFTANQNYTQVAGLVNGTTLRIWIAEDTVTGPQTAVVDNHIAVFNGTTGKIIEDGGFTIEDLQVDVPEYTIAKLDTAETGYISSYVLKRNNDPVGATINIPKDYLVKSGSVVDVVLYEGHYYESTDVEHENELDDYGVNSEGKYLKFIINTADTSQGTGNESLVYISVSDLVDDYVAGAGIRIINQVGSGAKSIAIKLSLATNGLELVSGEGFDSGLKLNLASYDPGRPTLYHSGAMTGEDKFKLDNIESGAEANVQSDWDQTNNSADDYIKNKPENLSDFTNDVGFITDADIPVTDVTVGGTSVVDSNGVAVVPAIPDSTSDLVNDSGFITAADVPSPADAAPLMDGTATIGSSNDYAREDHVHPSDTSKADKVSNAIRGNFAGLDSNGNLTDSGHDSSELVPSGGTTGQVLAKHSNTDNDVEWVTPEETEMSVSINYSDLVALKTGGNLVPGTKYRIIDYTCTTNQANTQSAGHPFDIIVTADSETELNENARAAHRSGDNYFQNCDLDSWELKYCLENDTNRFAWASTNGKGVIYYMKDEWGNIAPFDFKNMLFTRSATWFNEHQSWATSVLGSVPSTDMNFYFLSWVTQNNAVQDLSIVGQTLANNDDTYSGVYNNEIKETTSKDIGITEGVTSNTFALPCTVIVNAYNYQTGVFYGCYGNTFGNGCYNNTFGNRFTNVTFGDRCYSNTFGNNCYNNTLGNSCYSNLLGNGCVNNSFGSNCSQNTFGDYCFQNSFGIGCYENSFGNYFINNNLGNYCYSNTFGNYCQYLTVFGNVVYCNVTGGTSSDPVKNAQILNGTQGTSSSNKRTISFAADTNYTQVAGLVNGNTLRIWIAEYTVTGPQTAVSGDIPTFSGTGSNSGKQIVDSGHKVNELLPSGGTTGQVLAKESNTNFDVEWVTLEETEMSVSINYSDLVTLKNGGNLVPGTKYRIIDYSTTVSEDLTDVSVADHRFDIIVTALSETELDHRASAIRHEGDTYFSDCDLSKWQLWYDIENDTEKYEWAVGDSSSGNGGAKGSIPEYAPEYILSDDISSTLSGAGLSIALVFQGIETITIKEDVECYVYGTSVQAEPFDCVKLFLQDYPSVGTSIYGIGSKGDIHTISTVTGISRSTQPTNGTKIIAKSVTSGATAVLLNNAGVRPELEFNGQIVMYKGQNCYSYGSSAQYTVLAKEYKNISGIIVADGVSPIVPKKVSEPGTNVIILDGENEIPDPITTISQETVVVGGSGGGTGVIYRMIDEWGNDCPYDFKNIMFTDNGTNYYTFDALVNSVHYDFSVAQTSKNCYDNTIKSSIYKFGELYKYYLSRNVFKNTDLTSSVCYSNTLKNNCYNNIFGDNCYSNSFGNNCYQNSFGNNCYQNSFGNGCTNNSFGNGCNRNSFGNGCTNNSFGNRFNSSTFGNDCTVNSFGEYCQHLTVFENVMYCNVTGGTSSTPIKNAQILNGTQGASSNNKLTITFTANQNYTQVAGLVDGTTLRIWIAEDTVTGPSTVTDNRIAVFDGTTGKVIKDGGLTVAELQAGIPSPADAAPLMDGTATIGSSNDYAREDHIHPKDTSKADKVSNAISGNFAGLDPNGNLTDSGHDSDELVPSGGTTGQVLAKHSGTDNDVEWVTHYWANQTVSAEASYITTPEVKQVTINGSTTDAASTDHCIIVYDTTNKCLKFTF